MVYDGDKPAAAAACRLGRRNRSTPLAKEKTCYVCAACGYETARWLGCCPDCGEWNTFEERKTVTPTPVASKTAEKAARYLSLIHISFESEMPWKPFV